MTSEPGMWRQEDQEFTASLSYLGYLRCRGHLIQSIPLLKGDLGDVVEWGKAILLGGDQGPNPSFCLWGLYQP